MAKLYGFTLKPHQTTGQNKFDRNYGVAGMARSINRAELRIPWGDEATIKKFTQLVEQLYSWRPYAKGSELTQDLVMALWFGWLYWQQRKKAMEFRSNTTSSWKRAGISAGHTAGGVLLTRR
jgi:hypothetical protein